MKYCLSSRQNAELLKQADEIKIELQNFNTILDLYEINPSATFILNIPHNTGDIQIDWEEIEKYNIMAQGKFIIATTDVKFMVACKNKGIKFYYNIPINSFYDLRALQDCGSYYALIDAPLTHTLDKVKEIGLPVRVAPNIAYYAVIPRRDGVLGSWIRPEDVSLYEDYIDVFEFEDCDLKKERTLFNIYKKEQKWPGQINTLITNLNYKGTNRLLPRDFGEIRLNCAQRCLTGTSCKICYNMLNMADPERIDKILSKHIINDKNDKIN